MRYEIFGSKPDSGQWRWEQGRANKAIQNYERYASEYSSSMSINDYFIEHLMATNEKIGFRQKKMRMARFNTMYRRRLESY